MQTSPLEFFTLYELPISLVVNKAAVQKKFYVLSREFHPDNFSLASTVEQEEALHKTASINKAKKVLDDPYLRLEYILKEKGLIEEEEKFQLPMDFLSDMMELNEEKMEWMMNEEEEAKALWMDKWKHISNDLASEVDMYFKAEDLSKMDVNWNLLKEYYFKKKYLNRLAQ